MTTALRKRPLASACAAVALAALVAVCVQRVARANAPAGRYTTGVDGDSTAWAKDTQTGLTWKVQEELGGTTLLTDSAAAVQCVAPWRLPNIRELRSLVDETRTAPAIDTSVFTAAGVEWSSTRYARTGTGSWSIDFSTGSMSVNTGNAAVRCVR
ncbi:MAG: DUF1566 domain-containing protein [Pseudomonadota bacterium]